MDSDNLFEVPLYFIREYLTGWVILCIIVVSLYFIILRNYYLKREQFYDKSQQMKNNEEIEDVEENINNLENIKDNDAEDDAEDDDSKQTFQNKKNSNRNSSKNNSKNNSRKQISGENNTEIKGTSVFEGFEIQPTPSNTSTNTSSNTSSIPQTTQQIINTSISTTLFNNLKLNTTQIDLCNKFYNQVINTYITDLAKLVKLKTNNEYLNSKKQFDVIIAKGIDNIMNYLANTIKSPLVLTRTSVRTDVINNLTRTLEFLINNANTELSAQMTKLASLNSTTIDYKSMLNGINESRDKLAEYMEIDKLVVNNGSNLGNYDKQVNKILDKSFVLPIYERNFDKINQLIKSDFNDNETNLANKYGQAYTDFINENKKNELDINPMRLASKIESGIVNMLTNLGGSEYANDIIEQINPIPEQSYNLVNNTIQNNNLNTNANIYNDKGNLGSYLVDNKTRKQVVEGFEDARQNNNKNNNAKKTDKMQNTDIMSNLLSGNFLQYIMDFINEKLNIFYKYYNNKFNLGTSNTNNTNNYNIEENMIPAGFLFFILSMLVYFIDTTS